jgi:hypothetical protein
MTAQSFIWSDGTARTLSKGRFETGLLLAPGKYGVSNDLEISSYIIGNAFVPNLSIKKFWGSFDHTSIASAHSLSSPTPLLKFVAREKIGGLLPPDNYIPTFVVVENTLIVSHQYVSGHDVTARLGVIFAFGIDDKTDEKPIYERMQTIDYAFIFPRTAYLTRVPSIVPKIDVAFKGAIFSDFGYAVECSYSFFSIRDQLREEDLTCSAFESSALARWYISNNFSCDLGMIYSTGSYPFGNNWVIYPLIDVRFGM